MIFPATIRCQGNEWADRRAGYLEFIARVTSPIPDKGQVMVRYYGLCKALHKP